jgi:ABC-type glycerol-3-phosphate transport system permease component
MNAKKKRALVRTGLYVICIAICVFMIFPLLWGVASSFRTDKELFQYAMPLSWKTFIPQDFTTAAYTRIFTDFHFGRSIVNTLIVTFSTIALGLLINSMAAFAFACFEFPFKRILFAVVLMTFMIPFEAIALPLYKIASGLGFVDTLRGMVIPCIANGLVLFLFTQFFKELPLDLFEAARIDGASWLTIFRKIVLPLSIPVTITAALMIFISQWNAYLWPLIIGMSKDAQVIQTALGMFQQERGTLWSCLYAASMVSAAIPLFVFLPLQKYYVQGITSSGVKG